MLFADLKERRARDPSHTVMLRKAFRARGFLCLRSLRNEMRKVVAEMDLLGLGPEQKSVFSFQSPAQRLYQFRGWLENAAFANLDARWWLYPFIAKAVKTGLDRANKELPNAHFVPNFAAFDNLHALAKNEIDGIIASMVQKSTRLAHAAMLRRLSPYTAFNTLTVPLDGDIKNRIALLTNFLTIKSHAQAKIAVYRSAGVKQIGIDPEYMRSLKTRGQSHDCRCNVAVFDDDDDDNYAVGWGTADDDDVCVQCDEMAQDSPYLIDEIEDLFPLHPNCRCSPYPWPGRATDSITLDGENPGHAFRGNQYVEGESGPEGGTAAPPPKEKRVAAVNPAVAHVGGDDWNRATAVRTETEYQHAKPELEAAAEKIGTGTETDDEPHIPESWDDLDEDTKDAAEEHFKETNLDAELEAAHYSYHDSGDAYHDAQHEVANSYDNEALSDLPWVTMAFAAADEQSVKSGQPSIPYTDEQLHKAISLHVDDDDDDHKVTVSFDDAKLQEPNNMAPKEQMQLPGIPPEERSAKLTPDMRKHLTTALTNAFEKEAKDAEDNIEPPDYLTDSAHEALDESWNYKSKEDKFAEAINAGLVETPDDDDYDNSLISPTKFDPLEEHGDTTQYKRTGAFARKLAVDRASELLVQRGIVKDADSATQLAHRMDQHLWSDWKSSSTSANGLLMQKACAEEFGGRFNIHAALGSGGAAANLENKIKNAAETFDGMDAVKAYVRAKWETTQYILDKAGIDTVTVYRAINLPKDDLWTRDKVGSFTKLPDLKVQRNGAASTTTDLGVANGWGDRHNRIVLRMEVPRTAILSVPAYGQNVYKEHEVVLIGGAVKHWDAWEGQAPSVKSEPFETGTDHHE